MRTMPIPLRLTLLVAVSIFVIEALIMALIPMIHLDSPWVELFLDSFVLIVALIPILYAFLFRPLMEANAQLRDALKAAGEAAEAKSQFLACMSHELRTPLNAVIGMTQLLLDTPLSAQQAEFARMSSMGGETLLTLINNILDFSKLEAGKMDLEFSDLDLLHVLEDCAKLMAVKAHEKGLEIAVSMEPDVPRALRGDGARLQQVLMNLLNNAIKFTPSGEIVLGARRTDGTEKTVTVRLEVKDTGIGIPLEIQPQLFQPFMQADASTTRRYGGTGLGLAISRWIVELMGGRIGLTSAPEKGSAFWCEIPFELGEGAKADKRAGADLAGLAALEILVVDDNATNREILEHRLDAWGMSCRCETDGPAGLAELERAAAAGRPYGLAIIDMQMPGMDGLELARAVRAKAALSGVPLILMTSMDRVGLSQDARRAGLAACLTKPVRQSALFDAIVNAVSRSEPRGEIAASEPAAPAAKTERILVVEDNPVNQLVAVHMLKKLGYQADLAANGIEALRAVKAADYALILMDSRMPEMDGFKATAAIRGMGGRFRDIPIVALTADAMAGDRQQCMKAGMNDYLSKPLSIGALERVLSHWL